MSDPLADGEPLTQYVFADSESQDSPRPRDIDGLSLLRGQLDPDAAARYVRFQVHEAYEGDGVRHTTVDLLRGAGFTVTLTPSRRIPVHVSVKCEAQWTPETSRAFSSCFTEIIRREGR